MARGPAPRATYSIRCGSPSSLGRAATDRAHMILSMSREYTHCPEKSAATISLFSATTWSRRVQDALRRIGGRRIQCLLLNAHLHQMGLRRFRRLGRGSSYPKLHNSKEVVATGVSSAVKN